MNQSPPPGPRRRSALVLYGSETGNAQEVAEELGALAERLHFTTHVAELNAFKPDSLASFTFTVFVVATTGQGDLPANARSFWTLLRLKRLLPSFLSGVSFTTFGLGDSSYPKFNWAALKLNKRLLQLGANEIYPGGEADQQHPEGLEGTFLPWQTDFRRHLLETYPLPPDQEPIPDDVQLPPKWILQLQDPNSSPQKEHAVPGTHEYRSAPGEKKPARSRLDHDQRPLPDTLSATLTQNKRLTPPKHFQDVRHFCLTVPDPVSYVPGDVIAITPKNFAEDVDALITLMGWEEQADQLVSLVPNGDLAHSMDELHAPPIPDLASYPKLTLRALIMDYLDIRAIPRRAFFSNIAHYTEYEMHKERLLEFTNPNPEFLDDLWDYTSRPRRSILEVLDEFESVKIPWQHAAAVFPIMRGRQFSIASGGALKKGPDGGTKFELLIAIVKYRTVIKRIREGVCTRYISALQPGSTLRVQLQRGGLNSTAEQLLRPMVLIGPGTGVAPLRSMLWEKAALIKAYREENPDSDPLSSGKAVLLYGGRNRDADYFFSEEWQELIGLINLQVLTAFSRDQKEKVYVQDVVRQNSDLFFRLLHEMAGSVYVCGSSGKMPQAVREALTDAFEKGSEEFDRAGAEEYLLGMEKTGRYKQETW